MSLPLHSCGLEASALTATVPHLKGSIFSVKYLQMLQLLAMLEAGPAARPGLWLGAGPGEEPGFVPLLLIGCYARHAAP